MAVIDLPDEHAEALRAKAAAQGLTLEAWLEKLACADMPMPSRLTRKEAVEGILELQKRVKPDPEGWTIRDYINFGRR